MLSKLPSHSQICTQANPCSPSTLHNWSIHTIAARTHTHTHTLESVQHSWLELPYIVFGSIALPVGFLGNGWHGLLCPTRDFICWFQFLMHTGSSNCSWKSIWDNWKHLMICWCQPNIASVIVLEESRAVWGGRRGGRRGRREGRRGGIKLRCILLTLHITLSIIGDIVTICDVPILAQPIVLILEYCRRVNLSLYSFITEISLWENLGQSHE